MLIGSWTPRRFTHESDGGCDRLHRYGHTRLLPDYYGQANILDRSRHSNSGPVHPLHMVVAAKEFRVDVFSAGARGYAALNRQLFRGTHSKSRGRCAPPPLPAPARGAGAPTANGST